MTNKSIVTLEDKASQLDAVALKYSKALDLSATPFTSALVLSRGISSLRELLDDGIMREIMKLADTPLGFMTDRKNAKDKDGKPLPLYRTDEVKDAIIEASLRGFRVAGNEFNIIASRFYAAKAGLHRKVVNWPGVTDLKETFGIPKMSGEKGAVVTAEATWLKDGVKGKLTREFAIRVNAMMGTDAIIGKCQRKLYAAVLNQLSGIVTPDGEVEESSNGEVKVSRSFKPEDLKPAKIVAQEAPQPEPQAAQEPNGEEQPLTALDRLKAKMVEDKIVNGEILELAKRSKAPADSLEELTEYFVTCLLDDWENVVAQAQFIRIGG